MKNTVYKPRLTGGEFMGHIYALDVIDKKKVIHISADVDYYKNDYNIRSVRINKDLIFMLNKKAQWVKIKPSHFDLAELEEALDMRLRNDDNHNELED